MGIADKLSKELTSWATLVILIVIASIVLVKFKVVEGVGCNAGYTYNASGGTCYFTTNTSIQTAQNTLGSTVDTFVTALSEPKNWITIVVVALIGFALFAMFKKLGKNR